MTSKLALIVDLVSLFDDLCFNSPLLDVFSQVINFKLIFHHLLAILLLELLHLFLIVPVRNDACRIIYVKRRNIKSTLKPMLYFLLIF
jgi:hypothetical protein